MINYEKIKVGKGLTPNQKRIREIYLKHKLNLEGQPIKERQKLNYHYVRIQDFNAFIYCSRKIRNKYLVFDDKQKENISVKVVENTIWNKYSNYPSLEDDIYVILGRKNIKGLLKGKCGICDGLFSAYDNKGKFCTVNVRVNHRKKVDIELEMRRVYISKKKLFGQMIYAHGENKADSLEALKYKIKSMVKERKQDLRNKRYSEFFQNLKFNSMINIKRYRFLTGACQRGCEDFANRYNLPTNTKLKVSDLLRILLPTDFGYDRFINALGIEVRG